MTKRFDFQISARSGAARTGTIKMHRGALVHRLGVQTSTEAIRIAVEAGL